MATVAQLPARPPVLATGGARARTTWRDSTARLALGTALLLAQWAFIAGAGWDIQWHIVVGRDRPLSPPHVLLLAGIILTGVVALTSVLLFTAARRRRSTSGPGPETAESGGRPHDGGAGPIGTVRFLRVFYAPLGVYVAGFGALFSAVGFPLDDYWHRLYGLDTTLWSPFHVMIISGMALAALGTAYVFAPVCNALPAPLPGGEHPEDVPGGPVDWRRLAGAVGVACSLATLAATLLLVQAQALDRDGIVTLSPRPVIVYPPLLVALTLPALVASAVAARVPRAAVRVPCGATLFCIALSFLRVGLLLFIPWAVRAGAALEGEPLGRGAAMFAATPAAYPAWIWAAGLVIDAVWWLVLTRRLRLAPALLGGGLAAALLLATLDRPWAMTLPGTADGRGIDAQAALLTSLPAVAICGLLAVVVGLAMGAALRRARV